MFIGQLADAAGVGVETVRFHEREGLLPEPPRTESGYRDYDSDAIRRVRFILRSKDLGFTRRRRSSWSCGSRTPSACGTVEDSARTGECPILDALEDG